MLVQTNYFSRECVGAKVIVGFDDRVIIQNWIQFSIKKKPKRHVIPSNVYLYGKGKKGRRHQKAAVGEKEKRERPQGKRGRGEGKRERQGSSERLGITLKRQRLEKYP